jgi:hypothetical protein
MKTNQSAYPLDTPAPEYVNDSSRAGQYAAFALSFGPILTAGPNRGRQRRYRVAPIHTRFGVVSWFVWDTTDMDPRTQGYPIIRQAATRDEAVRGLDR